MSNSKPEFVIEAISNKEASPDFLDEVSSLIERGKLSPDGIQDYEGWLVARQVGSEALAGCVGYETRGSNVYMESLVVDPAHRRQGLGKQLTDLLFTDTLQNGQTLVALTLFWNNRFYENIGFKRADAKVIKAADDIGGRTKHRYCTTWTREKQTTS